MKPLCARRCHVGHQFPQQTLAALVSMTESSPVIPCLADSEFSGAMIKLDKLARSFGMAQLSTIFDVWHIMADGPCPNKWLMMLMKSTNSGPCHFALGWCKAPFINGVVIPPENGQLKLANDIMTCLKIPIGESSKHLISGHTDKPLKSLTWPLYLYRSVSNTSSHCLGLVKIPSQDSIIAWKRLCHVVW